MRLLVTLFLVLIAAPAFAQTPGNCAPGTAEADLDVGDVLARVFNGGNLFFGNGTTSGNGYLVPKNSGHSPIFAANVWVGGMVEGDLRVTAATYLDFEFWPGPLEPGATLPNPDDCSTYDRIWVVSATDVRTYDDTGEATPDLAEWPVDLGAEVVDGDGIEGNYDLAAGDRPRIYGSQTAFWVMNDVGNEHGHSESPPIGIEAQVTAFAISSEESAFNQATVYRYRLVNRNSQPFEAAHLGMWADLDLGGASDDYIGSDSTRGLTYVYNADNNDFIYGTPPAFGMDLLSGYRSSRWPKKHGPPETTGTPRFNLEATYNALRGLWNDGTPITEGGDGYESGGSETLWAFPGDPVTDACWSMVNVDCAGGSLSAEDVQHLVSSPSFTLAPGETRTFDIAFLFAQGESNLDSITELRAASDLVQTAYDDGSLFDTRLPVTAEDGAVTPTTARLDAVYPNPVRDRATVSFTVAEPGPVRLVVHDVLGRRVRTLAEGPLAAGEHTVSFEAADLPSGLYLVVLEAGGQRETKKMVLVR